MAPKRNIERSKNIATKVDRNVMDSEGAMILPPQPQQSSDWWEAFSRRLCGSLSNSVEPVKFESLFKISRNTFDYICSLVQEDMNAITSRSTDLYGNPLSLYDKVTVALRRLSSADTLTAVGKLFGINHLTAGHRTWRFVESMEIRALHHLSWPSEAELKEIKSKFERMGGPPNCCGAIDITHILVTAPAEEKDVWLDREKKHMLLQAVVDPEMS